MTVMRMLTPLTLEQLDDDTITAFRGEDGVDATTIALCNLALGHLRTEGEFDEAIATLQEDEYWWFRSLARHEARAEVLARINPARARELAQEKADDEYNCRTSDAHAEAMMRHSHYPDGDPEDWWR